MQSCKARTLKGTNCANNASHQYGGEYCYAHCKFYFEARRDKLDGEKQILNDELKAAYAKLNELAKSDNNKTLQDIVKTLNITQTKMFKKNEELVDVLKREADAIRQTIRDESNETRTAVTETGTQLAQGMAGGFALLLQRFDEKFDDNYLSLKDTIRAKMIAYRAENRAPLDETGVNIFVNSVIGNPGEETAIRTAIESNIGMGRFVVDELLGNLICTESGAAQVRSFTDHINKVGNNLRKSEDDRKRKRIAF